MAMTEYYDRYKFVRDIPTMRTFPNVEIGYSSNDLYIKYERNKTRLDNVSYKYYGSPDYAWLILQANPGVPTLEFEIPNGTRLRIPYPLTSALNRYETKMTEFMESLNK